MLTMFPILELFFDLPARRIFKTNKIQLVGKHVLLLLMGSAMGMPILRQLAASGLSKAARSSQFGSFSLFSIMGFERAMMYSVLHKSFSRISHSSLHRSRGLSVPELRSQVGKAKWQREGMANWEQRSDKWLEVPIMVKAARNS